MQQAILRHFAGVTAALGTPRRGVSRLSCCAA
jgi:hypothetical protein